MAQSVAETDSLERDRGQSASGPGVDAAIQEAGGDVLQHAHPLDQAELLEDEAKARGAKAGDLSVGHVCRVNAGDPHEPRCGPVQGPDNVEEGGLSGPGRPDHREQLTRLDAQAHPAQRFDRAGVAANHVAQLDGSLAHVVGTSTSMPSWSSLLVTSTMPRSSKSPVVTITVVRQPAAFSFMTATAYLPSGCASSAVTGTASTPLWTSLTIPTPTGARSSVPPAVASVIVMVTVKVAVPGGPFCPPSAAAVATVLIAFTVPAVVFPSGNATSTASPALTFGSSATFSCTSTWCWVDVASRTGWPGCANIPTLGSTAVTLIGPGMKMASPGRKMPVCGWPSEACQLRTACAVNQSKVLSILSTEGARPSATRLACSS